MISFITTCRPHVGEAKAIHELAVPSWPSDDVMIYGTEEGVPKFAHSIGVQHIPSPPGRPYLRSVLYALDELSRYRTRCYINSDIILTPGFLGVIACIDFPEFLAVGLRRDVPIEAMDQQGVLYTTGSDFFCYMGDFWGEIPPRLKIGYTFWDNWLMWHALDQGIPLVDITDVTPVKHIIHADRSGWDAAKMHQNRMSVSNWTQKLRAVRDATWRVTPDLRVVKK